MAKGPKVSRPEYVDFNSDEDDLLGDDDLLVHNSSEEYYDEIAINHANRLICSTPFKKRSAMHCGTVSRVLGATWEITSLLPAV